MEIVSNFNMPHFLEEEIKKFVRTNPLNRITTMENSFYMFDDPLIGFADGDDAIFTKYKTIIGEFHLTPREAIELSKTSAKSITTPISVVSWILPFTKEFRESSYDSGKIPSQTWAVGTASARTLLFSLQEHMVKLVTNMGYVAVAPQIEPYWEEVLINHKYCSNWSDKHMAYAAGLGTFSLTGGLISERGISIHVGSLVTNLMLPASPRTSESLYANCLFYRTGKCKLCAKRCPVGAITEKGIDDEKCYNYLLYGMQPLADKYDIDHTECGMCSIRVPCESRNPAKKIRTAPKQ
jgi:epoxyqueuosine reductase